MVTDPYSVLEISRDATDEEIKKAYRAMSRKYHPDANINSPNPQQVEEKFKEIQQAYQQIMKEREDAKNGYSHSSSGGSYGQSGYGGYGSYGGFGGFGDFGSYGGYGQSGYGGYGQSGYGQSGQGSSGTSQYQSHLNAAANYIRSGHYTEALNVLDGIPERSAFWFFLSASANSGLGNNVIALEHARKAVEMEPSNMQYRSLLNSMESGGSWYDNMSGNYGRPTYSGGNLCLRYMLMMFLCNCCCGGGGMCCGGNYGGPYGYM